MFWQWCFEVCPGLTVRIFLGEGRNPTDRCSGKLWIWFCQYRHGMSLVSCLLCERRPKDGRQDTRKLHEHVTDKRHYRKLYENTLSRFFCYFQLCLLVYFSQFDLRILHKWNVGYLVKGIQSENIHFKLSIFFHLNTEILLSLAALSRIENILNLNIWNENGGDCPACISSQTFIDNKWLIQMYLMYYRVYQKELIKPEIALRLCKAPQCTKFFIEIGCLGTDNVV